MDNTTSSKFNTAAEFAPSDWNEWMAAVRETLKGADFDRVMKAQTYEGIELSPIYTKEDLKDLPHLGSVPGSSPFVRGSKPLSYLTDPWFISQSQQNPHLKDLNRELLDELGRGMNAINLKLHESTSNGSLPTQNIESGIALSCMEDLRVLFADIDIDAIHLYFQSHSASALMMGLLNAYIKEKGYDLRTIHASFGFDPIAELVSTGQLPYSIETAWQMMYQMAFWADLKAPLMRTISIDAPVYENAGASSTQELALAIATAIGYINGLLKSGLSIEQIAPRFQLNLSLGSNFFMEIAKIRAARLLWSEMMKAFGASDNAQKIFIHAVTSKFNKSIYDPYVNILRTGTEAFAGVIGGVDSMDVGTFDELMRTPDAFSKRIARNQQIIIGEEAHLSKVIDPAGGCYYIEKLTAQIAETAWSIMQEIEAQGGMLSAVQSGYVTRMIAKTADARIANVHKRKDVFVGVNMYANPDESPLETNGIAQDCFAEMQARVSIAKQHSNKSQSLAQLQQNVDNDFLIDMLTDAWIHNATIDDFTGILGFDKPLTLPTDPLVKQRATKDLEMLRKAVESCPKEASIFLCSIGKLAMIKPRMDFSVGFLQVAGFNVISEGPYPDAETALAAFMVSKADAICICAPDDLYPSVVPQICSNTKADTIILAGYPVDMVQAYSDSGVGFFIHLKADLFKTLSGIATQMGVSK